jgi:hypothetical protein
LGAIGYNSETKGTPVKNSILAVLLTLGLQTVPTTSAIEGVVLEKGTETPVPGVKVALYGESLPTFQFGAPTTLGEGLTDAQGRFTVAARPGRYRVVPEKEGYIFAHPVALQYPREPGTWVDIPAQQKVQDLRLQVQREGVISGRVIDSTGNVFPGTSGSASVQVYRYDDYGNRSLAGVPGVSYPTSAWSFVRLNDRGEFRLYGLPPGDYYVSVGGGGSSGFAPTMTDEARATPIHVEAGEEIRLGTMTLPPLAAKTKVTLRFMRDGVPFTMALSQVHILPAGGTVIGTGERSESVLSLTPGNYEVLVTSGPLGTDGGWGRTKLVVGSIESSQDLEIKPSPRLKGNFSVDGVLLPQPRPLACRFVGSEPFMLAACNNTAVAPVHLRFGIQGLQPNAYVKSVTVGGRDILGEGIRVEGDTEFDIQIGSRGADLQGTVTDSKNEKVAHGVVALVPDAPLRGAVPLYKSGPTDIEGRFELHGIAPGKYHLFAWRELPGFAYLNAEFMKRFEELGKAVVIEKTEPVTVDVRLADETSK